MEPYPHSHSGPPRIQTFQLLVEKTPEMNRAPTPFSEGSSSIVGLSAVQASTWVNILDWDHSSPNPFLSWKDVRFWSQVAQSQVSQSRAKLRRSEMHGAKWHRAKSHRAKLRRAKLRRARLNKLSQSQVAQSQLQAATQPTCSPGMTCYIRIAKTCSCATASSPSQG